MRSVHASRALIIVLILVACALFVETVHARMESRTVQECTTQQICKSIQKTTQDCRNVQVCQLQPKTTSQCQTTNQCQMVTRMVQQCQPVTNCVQGKCTTMQSCRNVAQQQQVCQPKQVCRPVTSSGQVCGPQQQCQPKTVTTQECKPEQRCQNVTKQVWVPDPIQQPPVGGAHKHVVTPKSPSIQTGTANSTPPIYQSKSNSGPGAAQPSAQEAAEIARLQAYKKGLEEKLRGLQAQKKTQDQQKVDGQPRQEATKFDEQRLVEQRKQEQLVILQREQEAKQKQLADLKTREQTKGGIPAAKNQPTKPEENARRAAELTRMQEQATSNVPLPDQANSKSAPQPTISTPTPAIENSEQVASASGGWDRAWQSLKPSSKRQLQSAPIPALGRTVPEIYSQQYRTDMRELVEAKTASSGRQAAAGQGQCTDYARALFSEVKSSNAPKLPTGIGDAKDWYAFARTSKDDKYATAVPGAIARVPPGSIVVWGASEKNPYGHVGVVKTNDGTGKMTITEMNYGGNFDPATGRTSNVGKVTEKTLSYQEIQKRPVYKDGQLSSAYPLQGFILPY